MIKKCWRATWAGFSFHSKIHSYTWGPFLVSPWTCTGAESEARALLLLSSVSLLDPPFPLRWLRFSSTAEHWRWGQLSGAVSKRFSASKMVRVSQVSCLLLQSLLNCQCPSSSFHTALYVHCHWHLGSEFLFSWWWQDAENVKAHVSLLSLPLNTLPTSLRVKIKQLCLISRKSQTTVQGWERGSPALPIPLSQLLLPERQAHVVAKNTLQREYTLPPVGEYKLSRVVIYTTSCGWEKHFPTSLLERVFLMKQKPQSCPVRV